MQNIHLETVLAVILAYLIGSISSAIITCKILRLPDPRSQGSGNPGATNVLRFGGKKAAIVTLLGDILKGVIPVLVAKLYGLDTLAIALVAFAAFLGHLYPVFFRFEGGKGVATAFGCIITLAWPAGLSLAGIWLFMAAVFRYSSLAALTAAIAAPILVWGFSNTVYALAVGAMSVLLIYRHAKNISNLLAGKEKRIGER
jgi:glycerol-3-phosphate acyltransferase PlsY